VADDELHVIGREREVEAIAGFLADRPGGPAALLIEGEAGIGGATSVAVVDGFVGRCAGDDRINGKFARSDVPRLKKMLVDQISGATGLHGRAT
jgi:hypothetical protein